MVTLGEGECHRRARQVRGVGSEKHLQGSPFVIKATEPLPIFLHTAGQVTDDPGVAAAEAAIGERLRSADATVSRSCP